MVKVRSLVEALRRKGHHSTVLTADLGLSSSNSASMKITRGEWGWESESEGIRTIYLSTLWKYRALTLNPGVLGFCRSHLKEFDLAHFYGLYDLLGPSAGRSCRQQGVPYVIEPMGMYRPIDRSFRKKRIWHRLFGEDFWHGASLIVATSEMEEQELFEDKVPRENLAVRYNGIEENLANALPPRGLFRGKHGIPADEPVILFLSRIIPRKGAEILVDAFSEVCRNRGWLVIAGPEGEPGYLAQIRKRARDTGVADKVIFPGALYGPEKLAAYADADIFALPSRYENFANVAAEAVACDVPVIISRQCGIRSVIEGRAGLIIEPEKAALASALRSLLTDSVLYSRLKSGCREVAEKLTWTEAATQMEALYEGVLGRRHANE